MIELDRRCLTSAIKDEARRLGFQWVGVTTPDPPPHLPVYERWLDDGLHGEMAYLATARARQRRTDPRQILPECRAILVLGIKHPSPDLNAPLPAHSRVGRVAAYAWGADYHDVLPRRLKDLVAFIERLVGHPVPNRRYTDTGPLLERDFAQRAGLGWIGKNTCLINPRMGSYFLLAEILLGIDLEFDSPFLTDHCGSCTRCLEACPTGCILPDRTIDARRCISYLTIELKGPISPELRPLTQNWVFGCDVCQEVCPWNQRFATPVGDPSLAPFSGVRFPDLYQELKLDMDGFNRKFRHSPVKRARRGGYLRNVAVALGNSGDVQAVPSLARALVEDPDPLVRSHAAWALGHIGGEVAILALNTALESETDPAVRDEIQAALAGTSSIPAR